MIPQGSKRAGGFRCYVTWLCKYGTQTVGMLLNYYKLIIFNARSELQIKHIQDHFPADSFNPLTPNDL
jgi:hypothetical protein